MAAKREGIMLCYPFEERRLAKWKPPYIIQPKLDGDRCRAIINEESNAILLSSEQHIFNSVPHIYAALKHLGFCNIELDGELYIHGAPHNEIHSIVSRTENLHPDYKLVEFHVFDIVNLHLPQVERTRRLIDLIPTRRNFSPIQLVPSRVVSSLDEIMRVQEEYARLGYEGFVLRDSDANYVRKRSTQVMKFKPRKEDIYEIVGTQEEVSILGIPKNSLGALICRGDDGTLFNVGSGSLLTREARETLWQERETLVGKWARVKYQHLTHASGVPRFPVVVEVISSGL
jgi:ATP-dependent DNA ligase